MQYINFFALFLFLATFLFPPNINAQDLESPTPNPPEWRMQPTASGSSSIKMAAKTATDASVVEYYFECVTGNCNSSSWQSSPIYEDTNLMVGTSYSYRFKVRDLSSNQNETNWSNIATATPNDMQAGGFTYNWGNYDNSDFSELGEKEVSFDFTDVRPIRHVPPVGVHPRIFFNPEDISDIQNRLNNTTSGQAAAAQVHAFTTLLNLGYPPYNHNSSYGLDAFGNRYIDNAGFWNAQPYYDQLIAEDPTVWDAADIKRRHLVATLMALEAFECLMKAGEFDADTGEYYDDRAADLAKAMAFWASLIIGDPTVNGDSNNFNYFGGTHMALCYDLNYNSMTEAQRDLVRQGLAQITSDLPRHGNTEHPYSNTSNWSALNSFEIIFNLAIEGEEGYKPELTDRWMRAIHNFITYGWYKSGAGYEGLGKNYMFATTLVACAKRGYSLLGHPHVRAYGNDFLPAITQPFGHSFTSYDVWGGSGYDPEVGGYKFNSADAVGLKWIFPNSPNVDFMWRNYIEKAYNSSSEGYVYQQIAPDDSYYNYLIPAAVFASDYTEGDWATQNEVALSEKTDYFAADRGLAVLRSGFSENDLAVQFHARQDMGGHTHGDRNDFTLSALGRTWVKKTYGGSPFQPTYFHSCIIVDGLGVGVGAPDGDKCRQPATIVDFKPTENMSLIAADATYAYTWEWHWQAKGENENHSWLGSNGWEAVTETWNDFLLYEKGTESHYNLPLYDYAHWNQPQKYERIVKRLYNPMQRVLRSVAVVKGEKPFVLIVDDVQKDENVHNYQWLGQISRDLSIESVDVSLDDADYRCDVILKEPDATGDRRLLVRVLQNNGYDGSTPPAEIDTLEYFDFFNGNAYNDNPNFDRLRLIIESNSIAPDFKVMLFPHTAGDVLPTTAWNANHDMLSVNIGTENHTIAFEAHENARTDIRILDNLPHHKLQINAFLSAAYDASAQKMATNFRVSNALPLMQPYGVAPWNYAGNENVSSANGFPLETVDWVLVELRDANNPNIIIEQKAALLQANGSLVDAKFLTSDLHFYNLTENQNYIVVLRHRNHIDIMASNAISANAMMMYDFTQANNVVGGASQLTDMGNGVYGLLTADFDGNGVITVADLNAYLQQQGSNNEYLRSDANFDKAVNSLDYDLYVPNASKIGNSEIRY